MPQPQTYAQPAMRASYTQQAVRPVSMATSVHEDPYAAYSDEPHSGGQSPVGAGAVSSPPEYHSEVDEEPYATYTHGQERDSQMSLGDDEDYGYGGGRRVLKVIDDLFSS